MKPWFTSQPSPVQSYAEAVQRIERLRSQEPAEMNPVARLQFMTHGQQVQRAMVFVHGYTNCPQQFHILSQRFCALGYNVLSAPLPHHGLADRMTAEQCKLSAEELAQYTDEVVDIAQGLGQQVAIAGISGGGILAAYAAQVRRDVHLAVLMAPAFGFKVIPTALTGGVVQLVLHLPNLLTWWNPIGRERGKIAHAYPLFSTHALAQFVRLGLAVQAEAKQRAPAGKVLVITAASDLAVNKKLIRELVADWRRNGASVTSYEFPAHLRLRHDFIEPENLDTPIEIVYPKLIELITLM